MENKCIKCGGAMAEGFIFDRGESNYRREQTWVEGAPENSFWSGIQTSGRAAFRVRAMRCANCGFLELYADRESEAGSTLSQLFGA